MERELTLGDVLAEIAAMSGGQTPDEDEWLTTREWAARFKRSAYTVGKLLVVAIELGLAESSTALRKNKAKMNTWVPVYRFLIPRLTKDEAGDITRQ